MKHWPSAGLKTAPPHCLDLGENAPKTEPDLRLTSELGYGERRSALSLRSTVGLPGLAAPALR